MTEPSLTTLIDTGDEIEIQGHDKWSTFVDRAIIGLLPVVISILSFIALYRFFKKHHSDNTIAQTPPNHDNIPTSPSAPISDDQREIRRERILTNIIHKVRSNSAVRFVVVISNTLHFVFSQQYP